MKNIILGLVAAFALVSFAAPVRAQEAGAGDAKTDSSKSTKKSKKSSKKDKAADGSGDAAGADAAKK